jgi:hypothetical protein
MLGASLTTSFDHDAPRLGSTKERLMSGGAGRQGNMGTHGGLSLRVVTYAYVGSPIFGDRPDQARSAWPTRPLLATLTAHPWSPVGLTRDSAAEVHAVPAEDRDGEPAGARGWLAPRRPHQNRFPHGQDQVQEYAAGATPAADQLADGRAPSSAVARRRRCCIRESRCDRLLAASGNSLPASDLPARAA